MIYSLAKTKKTSLLFKLKVIKNGTTEMQDATPAVAAGRGSILFQ